MLYALVNNESEVIGEIEATSFAEVISEVSLLRDFDEVIFDGDVGEAIDQDRREEHFRKNPVSLPVLGDAEAKSMRFDGLPDRIDHAMVMALSLEDAWRRLFDTLPNGLNYRMSATDAAQSLLGDNAKTLKAAKKEETICWNPFTRRTLKIPQAYSKGLMLLPHASLKAVQPRLLDALAAGHPMLTAHLYGQALDEKNKPHWFDLPLDTDERTRAGYRKIIEVAPYTPLPLERYGAFTLCAAATRECMTTCLVHTGRNELVSKEEAVSFGISRQLVPKARLTESLLRDPVAFMRLLRESIKKHEAYCANKGILGFVRPNIFSDILWERVYPELFEGWSSIRFYDYTKIPDRQPPANYDLTYSFSGGKGSVEAFRRQVARGQKSAVVFLFGSSKLGEKKRKSVLRDLTLDGHPVVDGDCHDLRPLDPEGTRIVGLQYKPPRDPSRRLPLSSAFLVPVTKLDDGTFVTAATPRYLHGFDYVQKG